MKPAFWRAMERILTPPKRRKDLDDLAERIVVEPMPGNPQAAARGDDIDYDVMHEFDAYGEEVRATHEADGVRSSRAATVRVGSAVPAAEGVQELAGVQQEAVERARDDLAHARQHLGPFVRRVPRGERRYRLVWMVLVLGDFAGVLGAAILLGEIPIIAAGQAAAAGVAAVTAGLVGSAVRERQLIAARAASLSEDIPADLGRYRRLFVHSGRDDDLPGQVALGIVVLLALSIFALRASVEGWLAGLTFGGLAVATALASFINCWAYADDVADVLATYEAAYASALARYESLTSHPARRALSAAQHEVAAIEAEHELRATAARHHVMALLYGVLRRNPEVYGHGVEVTPPNRKRRSSEITGNGPAPLRPVDAPDAWDLPRASGQGR